ncbi:phospho-sugar mutase [Aquibacillus albus]|uniref:Phosphoglucomutase n=1 Tax=Aquibacillus albus TaxID=1168171 RepID=A0ABS2MXD6_9BACI|nr:phospho-sugar mutase [Aquibacillus albus]MBM7570524.1 phosphoglucomutase [Aquibacillus albus]
MSWQDTFKKWKSFDQLDAQLKQQLMEIANSEKGLEDAFYKPLTFGTGGMRGILGPGTNRMNIYTVRKAVEGLAIYLEENYRDAQSRGVAVAYDSRYMSKEFAVETAKVLGNHGIKTYIFESIRPTPLLSFAVRHLQAAAGIMITASHNPPEYNGFKVYNEDGGQVPPDEAAEIISKVNDVENELTIAVQSQKEVERQGLLKWVGEEVDQAYLIELKKLTKMSQQSSDFSSLSIVFTPLHGTSHSLIMKGLQQLGFQNIHVVEEQATPDPEFSTVASPNPEEHQAFSMAIEYGQQVDADILIGTDPDADRLGVAVKDGSGSYQVLTGNQLGTLLFEFLMRYESDENRKNGRLVKTIVTTEMGRAIASDYGVKTIDTLTGFKYIGQKIKEFESSGERFLFGYEESYGYLIGDFVRDKDAVQAAMVACEMASYWKSEGKTLLEALELLYDQYGYYLEDMTSLTLKGKDGAEKIEKILMDVRENPFTSIGGLKVHYLEDYQKQERYNVNTGEKQQIHLPEENVLKFLLENNAWVCLRPSGTEPKMKCYYGVTSGSGQESAAMIEALKVELDNRIQVIIK